MLQCSPGCGAAVAARALQRWAPTACTAPLGSKTCWEHTQSGSAAFISFPPAPACPRAAAPRADELLDHGESVLLVFLEPREGDGPGRLDSFQIYIDPQGGSDYKCRVEMRPQVTDGVYRLRDLSLELLGAHHVGAWCLHEDREGRCMLHCIPLAMVEGLCHAGGWVREAPGEVAHAMPVCMPAPAPTFHGSGAHQQVVHPGCWRWRSVPLCTSACHADEGGLAVAGVHGGACTYRCGCCRV